MANVVVPVPFEGAACPADGGRASAGADPPSPPLDDVVALVEDVVAVLVDVPVLVEVPAPVDVAVTVVPLEVPVEPTAPLLVGAPPFPPVPPPPFTTTPPQAVRRRVRVEGRNARRSDRELMPLSYLAEGGPTP